ncbi:MAG: hypothetical protein ACON4T_06375 [Synechococcus sp.]
MADSIVWLDAMLALGNLIMAAALFTFRAVYLVEEQLFGLLAIFCSNW